MAPQIRPAAKAAEQEAPLGPGLVLTWCLASLAGAVDLDGLVLLHRHYVSFMGGNTTSLAQALAGADWPQARLLGSILACFVAGAAFGEALAVLAGRRHMPVIVLSAAAFLVWPALFLPHAPLVMSFAMGQLNAALQRAGGISLGVTYVTGALVKIGQGVAAAMLGQGGWGWLAQLVPWSGLLAGAIASAAALAHFHQAAFFGPPFYAALLGVLAVLIAKDEPA